jgi:pimeloyl-ACP methyl ester carboxylesterase
MPKTGRWLGPALAASVVAAGIAAGSARAQEANEMTQFTTSPDGIPIAYETRGQGAPALVFVHGWSCDRTYWAGQLEPLSRDYRVVAIDLAGHGESGVGRENGRWRPSAETSRPSSRSWASTA